MSYLKIRFTAKSLFTIFCICFLLNINSGLANKSKIFVVANVDNQVITNLDLQNRYSFFVKTSNIKISSEAEKLFVLNQLTEKLIEEKLQIKNAKDSNIELSDLELTRAVGLVATSQGKNIQQIKSFLRSKNVSYDEYLNQIEAQILYKELVQKLVAPKIKVTKLDIDEMLELQKINIKKTSLNLAEILIPFDKAQEAESLSLANKLVQEIRNDNNFTDIARQFSKSTSREFDGEIGWVEILSLNSKIYEELNKLEVNQISNPVKISNGYYIFKIIDKKIMEDLAENEESKLKTIIFNQKIQVEARNYLNKLKKATYIKIDQEKLKTLL